MWYILFLIEGGYQFSRSIFGPFQIFLYKKLYSLNQTLWTLNSIYAGYFQGTDKYPF